jgi:Protein of unknown function (DUF3618)
MARSPAEIQADIANTRRVIEHQLDALTPHVPRAWWAPWLVAAGALGVGLVMSKVPMLRLLRLGARGVQTGVAVAGTVAAVDRFLVAQRHRRPTA